jgi:heme exporter protein CcmD
MNHWNYIVMAYGAFAVLMAWDYIAPRWSLRQMLGSIRLNQRRRNLP